MSLPLVAGNTYENQNQEKEKKGKRVKKAENKERRFTAKSAGALHKKQSKLNHY